MKLRVKLNHADGTVLAAGETRDQSAHIFENNWYFASGNVDTTYLVITDRTYNCPYKGVANWVDYVAPDVTIKNVAWVYQEPLPTYNFTRGQFGFYGRDTRDTTVEQISE